MIFPYLHMVAQRTLGASRRTKRAIMLISDASMLPLLVWCAFALRFSTFSPDISASWLFVAAPLVLLPVLYFCGFYRSIIRYLGSEVAWSIVMAVTIAMIILAAGSYMTAAVVPRSVFIILWMLSVLYLGGSRFVVRRLLYRLVGNGAESMPVAVFGAGGAGAQLVSGLLSSAELNPVLVVDDDPGKDGTLLCGVPVVNRAALQRAVEKGRIHTVLLAIPSAGRTQRMAVVRWLEELNVKVQTVPAFCDIASGKARLDQIQDVAIEDLLGRDAVPPREDLLDRCIKGKSVLVTGAGGSIGSELCRQIISLHPTTLVLFEQSELALYAIEKELLQLVQLVGGDTQVVAMLGSVVNRGHVQRLCNVYKVNTVYHAAAYKHVPIVESNPVSGVRNNIFGTLEAAQGAAAAGVDDFILISTDKAVRPTNVMGASKRFAEMVLQALTEKGSKTTFSMVRFGNVLGSSGSVVPLFRDQIRKGGPVTVTHPDVIRYFMTIPEAAQLVIQAGAMARGGEVFVLDMGEPVRITDLARTMIHLMGMSVKDEQNPQGDIEITFSGLRPGEKLYEELLIGDCCDSTSHEMIMRAHEEKLPWDQLSLAIEAFRSAIEAADKDAVRALLRSYVSGYQPGAKGAIPRLQSLSASRVASSEPAMLKQLP